MASVNSLFTTLPYELIEKIITSDPRYMLTIYFNILATCETDDKNMHKNMDKNNKKRKRLFQNPIQNPNIELANYLKSDLVIIRLFKQSPWFRFFNMQTQNKSCIPRIYKSLETVFQYQNNYLAGYFKTGINGFVGIVEIARIARIIEKNCDYDKLNNAIEKIGPDVMDVLNPECITWLIILSSFISGEYSIPTARIYFNGLTDNLFSTHLYSYIDRDLIPLIIITFDMGYQFIIGWDNVINKLIGFVWGGSSGQEYEYYQMKLEKYLGTRIKSKSCGKQIGILKFLKKISHKNGNLGGGNLGGGNLGGGNLGGGDDWGGLEESDFQLCSSSLSVL